jgi:hypothetical protein
MKQFVTGMIVAFGIIAVYACTTPGGNASSNNPVLFKVNGHPVTSEEFFSSPPASQAVNEFVMLASMKEEARKAGAQVDEKKLTSDIEELKKNVTQQGQTWDDFLKQQGMTEKAFLDQRRTFALFQALLKKKADVSDTEAKKAWDDDKQTIINQYAAENHLPDSEKAKVTFDQAKETAKSRVEQSKMGIVQGEVMNDIILNSKLEFVSLDPAKAKEITEKIMGPSIERAKKQKEESEKAEKEAPKTGATPGGPPPAGDGKAVAKPAEGAPAPKGGK